MSQNNYNLMNGETIIAEAQFHYFLYWLPALLVLLAVVLPFLPLQAPVEYMLYCSGALLVVALLWIVALNNGNETVVVRIPVIYAGVQANSQMKLRFLTNQSGFLAYPRKSYQVVDGILEIELTPESAAVLVK